MNSVIKLGVITFFASVLFISCGKKEGDGTESDDDASIPKQQDVSPDEEGGESPVASEEGIPPTDETGVGDPEGETPQGVVHPEGTATPPETRQQEEGDLPPGVVITPSPEADAPPKVRQAPTSKPKPKPEPVSYTVFSLSGLVDILFFEEDTMWISDEAVVLSQDISSEQTLLWLVENNIRMRNFGNDFSLYVHGLVERLSANDLDSISAQVCGGSDIDSKRALFFETAINDGTLVLVNKNNGSIIHRYGSNNVDSRIRDFSDLKDYHISSVTFDNKALTNLVVTSGSESKSFDRINAPEEATKSEFEVNVNKINLQSYYDFLNRLWDNGELSVCSANVT